MLQDTELVKRDTKRKPWNIDKMPTFKNFRFTFKQRRVVLKAFHALDMNDLADSIHTACRTLMMK